MSGPGSINRFRQPDYGQGLVTMLKYWRERGVTVPTYPIFDHGRTDYSGITSSEAQEVPTYLKQAGVETVVSVPAPHQLPRTDGNERLRRIMAQSGRVLWQKRQVSQTRWGRGARRLVKILDRCQAPTESALRPSATHRHHIPWAHREARIGPVVTAREPLPPAPAKTDKD